MHSTPRDPRIGLLLVGFSPPERLAAIARHLRWPGDVAADESRALYAVLGVGRAPWWRVYTRRTLLVYARALLRRERLRPAVEDTHQLGADAVVVDGAVVALWRPSSPDDRPSAIEVLAAATTLLR